MKSWSNILAHFRVPSNSLTLNCPKSNFIRFFSETQKPEFEDSPSLDALRKWGCSEADLSKLPSHGIGKLQSNLTLLSNLGFTCSDLVKLVTLRPNFLTHLDDSSNFSARINYLETLFGSNENLLLALKKTPLLITLDLHSRIKPVISQFQKLGVTGNELIQMLLTQPSLISSSTLNDQKLEYIRKIGVPKDSKLYKCVVRLIAMYHTDIIHSKLDCFMRFGFSESEVLGLWGRSPCALALSVGEIRRQLGFIIGTIELPASVVLESPSLVSLDLELVLRPRGLLAKKMEDKGVSPRIQEPEMVTALGMSEEQFLEAYVNSHPEDVACELMDFYTNVKEGKGLEESKRR